MVQFLDIVGNNQLRRQRDEELAAARYDAERREVKDQRGDEAYSYLHELYGPAAGDPTTYGQVEGIEQRREMHPLQVQGAQLGLDDANRDNARRAGLAGIAGLRQYGGDNPAAFLQGPGRAASRAIADAIGADEAVVAEKLLTDPSSVQMFEAMLQGGTDPETIKQYLEGADQFYAAGTRGTITPTGVKPAPSGSSTPWSIVAPGVAFNRATNQYSSDPSIVASVAGGKGTVQYATTTATEQAKEDVQEPQRAQARAKVQQDINDMRRWLEHGKEHGAWSSTARGPLGNVGAVAANAIPGAEFAQQVMNPEAQRARDEVKSIIPRFAASIMAATNMGVRMLDTEKEYERFIAQVNRPGVAYEVQKSALDRLERTYAREMAAADKPAATQSGTVSLADFLNE